jgi:hypothetical protein
MPAPETALIDTLTALQEAVGALVECSSCQSETGRRMFVRNADDALTRVAASMKTLAEAAHSTPTLFGKNVGDGLDTERAEAAEAMKLLRVILKDHALRSLTAMPGKTQLSFAGSRLVDAETMELVMKLRDGVLLDEASPAYLEATGQGAVAIEILRRLVNGDSTPTPFLILSDPGHSGRRQLAPSYGSGYIELESFEGALLDALRRAD